MSPTPIDTAPADTARAMHAAEMRGSDMQDDQDCTDCEGSGITHQTERYCTCAAGRELARYADDAPDRIYRQPGFKAEFVTAIPFERAAIPATTYITEAECQRLVDAAVAAEREACGAEVRRQFRIWEDFGASGFDDLCMAIIPEAIRARGQK